LPVAALALTLGWRDFLAGIRHPLLAPALRLSLTTSTSSLLLVVVLGSLVAWWVARHEGALSRAIETVTQLPAVIPPAVTGVALPLSAPTLVAGAAMSWARSLGEFGATLLFAGNRTGRTQTLPLAVYTAMETDLRAAQALALIMVVLAFAVLLVLRRMSREALGA